MSDSIVISLDAMGGDFAPKVVVEGADMARQQHKNLRFMMFGDEAQVQPMLDALPELKAVTELRHTPDVVKGEDNPAQALRTGRNSSMRLAINAVRDGEAAGVVSGGNTGALMAMSKFVLRTAGGIDRPAIASIFPTQKGETLMLDLGANVACDRDNLVQFALMGAVFARTVMKVERPTVGLLNIGTEDLKGNEEVRGAAEFLRSVNHMPFDFHGFVEGDDIMLGTVDVVVTDGFSGNIALKTAEGVVKFVMSKVEEGFRASWLSKLAWLLGKRSLKKTLSPLDPRKHNGGMFLGLNGIAVKSHGGTDALGYAAAVGFAAEMAAGDMGAELGKVLQAFDEEIDGDPTAE